MTPAKREALTSEAARINVATMLRYRPGEAVRQGLDIQQVTAAVSHLPTTKAARWARQTGRGRKRDDRSGTARLAMLAVHFVLSDRVTLARAITLAFNVDNTLHHGEPVAINSTRRAEVRTEVKRRLWISHEALNSQAYLSTARPKTIGPLTSK